MVTPESHPIRPKPILVDAVRDPALPEVSRDLVREAVRNRFRLLVEQMSDKDLDVVNFRRALLHGVIGILDAEQVSLWRLTRDGCVPLETIERRLVDEWNEGEHRSLIGRAAYFRRPLLVRHEPPSLHESFLVSSGPLPPLPKHYTALLPDESQLGSDAMPLSGTILLAPLLREECVEVLEVILAPGRPDGPTSDVRIESGRNMLLMLENIAMRAVTHYPKKPSANEHIDAEESSA